MANMTDLMEQEILDLLFINANFANVGDASGLQPSGAAGSFYISLHTANPGEAGSQDTSESAYTMYARVAVARSGAGWTRVGTIIENAAAITFPAATGGTETITYFGLGSDASGAGNLFIYGLLSTPRAVSAGITPSFAAGDLTVEAL